MQKERISITFEVDLDPVPGACHTLEYWVKATEADFKRFSWYNPKITKAVVVKEAPAYMDQIKGLAKELVVEMLKEKAEYLASKGVEYGDVGSYALIHGCSFQEAIEALYTIWQEKEA